MLSDACHKKEACFIITGDPAPNKPFVDAFRLALAAKKEELRMTGRGAVVNDLSETEDEDGEGTGGTAAQGILEKCLGCRKTVSVAHWPDHKTACRHYKVSSALFIS